MPGKSQEARNKQVLLRLTDHEHDVLAAAAYLEGVTPTELAREQIGAFITRCTSSDRVRRLLQERREHEAEKDGKLRSLRRSDGDAGGAGSEQ